MSEMLSASEAEALVAEHLGDSSRARHSVFVGHAMRRLAGHVGADAALWEIVGLVHDLDYEVTAADRSKHGIVASQWLADRLPAGALEAIAAHDHRTDVVSETALAMALRLADVLAVVCAAAGERAPALLRSADFPRSVERECADRPHLARMIATLSERLTLAPATLADIADTLLPPA